MKYLKIFTLCLLTYPVGEQNSAMAQTKEQNQLHWKQAAVLSAPKSGKQQLGLAGAVAGITQNRMILAGGANFPEGMPWLGGQKKYYQDLYVFSKDKQNSLIQDEKLYTLPEAIAYGASCSTFKGIVLAGGENESGLSRKVQLIRWNEDSQTVLFEALPDLPVAVANAAITAAGHLVFLAGGETSDAVSDQLLQLDLDHPETGWKKLSVLPKPVSHAVLVATEEEKGRSLYLIGGRKRNPGATSSLYAQVYQFEMASGKWITKAELPYALSAGTGLVNPDHQIQLFGGDRGTVFHQAETLIAAAAKESDVAKKEVINQEKIKVQSTHPGFSNEILTYNPLTNSWTVFGQIPFPVPVTTTAFTWGDLIVIPSGEIKAGVRSPSILIARPQPQSGKH